MTHEAYRYVLCRPIPFPEVLSTLDLALIAAESLHGAERTRLDARFASDTRLLTLVIDANTPVGQTLNQVFLGFARREFGEKALRVERIDRSSTPKTGSGPTSTTASAGNRGSTSGSARGTAA
ncbi:MAG: hypothetical protein IT435_03775 [Phycisphaerales bacterium]|nr:hypothetical protein [Phycisphaerales bacterium]